jgi:MFS family permease
MKSPLITKDIDVLATFRPLIPLFFSCFILFVGNGLTNTFYPLRMQANGLDTDKIGLIISIYFIGMLLGAMYSKNLIKKVGHIRMFSGSVSVIAASVLICALNNDIIIWSSARLIAGFCAACTYSAMESWLSESASQETRGRVLAAYNATVIVGLFSGQFFIGAFDVISSDLFIIGGIIYSSALIPIALSKITAPEVYDVTPMSLFKLYKLSPLGVVSCFTAGATYFTVISLLPVLGKHYGFENFTLSLYVGIAILGGFFLQYPIGYLSDRFDRRTILLGILIVSAVANIVASLLDPSTGLWPIFLATTIISGIISCIYPISISQTFDQLKQSEMISAMGSMIMAYAIGGVIGPYLTSIFMTSFGDNALFYCLALAQLLLAGFVIYRMQISDALPVEDQESFVMQAAAMAAPVDLDPRTEYIDNSAPSIEVETVSNFAETDPKDAITLVRSIAIANPQLAEEVVAAVVNVEGINVLRLYQVMSEAIPHKIIDVTRAIVVEKPELAEVLIKKLIGWYPEQVVPVAIEIGRVLPELRLEMAKIAVETAPESATQIREYYLQLLNEEQEAMRPADREEFDERDMENLVLELVNICSTNDAKNSA